MGLKLGDTGALERGRKSRKANQELGLATYREFKHVDNSYWEELAVKHLEGNLRLPMNYVAPSTSKMRQWLKKLNITQQEYLDWSGEKTMKDFARNNPTWGLKAWVGLLLEYLEGSPRIIDIAEDMC